MHRFTPAMILAAAGSYASTADATVFTQTFNLAFDPTNTQYVTVGDASLAQFSLNSFVGGEVPDPANDGGVKVIAPGRIMGGNDGTSFTGNFVDPPVIPSNGNSTINNSAKISSSSADQYLELSFQLDGETVYGLADFTPDMTLKTISYEVPSGAVPEPAVWMELILGLGLAGTAQRAARRRQPAAAAL